MLKKLLLILILVPVFGMGYVIFMPVNATIEVWDLPPTAERTGILTPNNKLSAATRFGPHTSGAPEDIVFDGDDNLITGLDNGEIFKLSPDGNDAQRIGIVSPQVQGMALDKHGTLYIANSASGLVALKDGNVSTLVTEVDDKPLMLTEDVSIAHDGIVYFTNGSYKHNRDNMHIALVDQSATGQLLKYEPQTKNVEILSEGFHFANGITVSHDQTFLIIGDSVTGQLLRYWLKGDQAGVIEVFVERLPGIPDNISKGSNGLYWVAMPAQRNDTINRSYLLQKIIAHLPRSMVTMLLTEDGSSIAAINDKGEIVHFLEDAGNTLPPISSVIEKNGYLYLGTWQGNYLHRIPIPKSDQ